MTNMEKQLRRNTVIFVSGTDTGVGKTTVTAALARFLLDKLRVGVMKPVASGAARRNGILVSADALTLMRSAGLSMQCYNQVNPVVFRPPISPHLAAKQARRRIDLSALRRQVSQQSRKYDLLLVEGIGGVAVPFTERVTWGKWIGSFPNPRTILVSSPRVGTLNHTLLSLHYLKSMRVKCSAIVISKYDDTQIRHRENRRELARLTGLPVFVCNRKKILSGAGKLIGTALK